MSMPILEKLQKDVVRYASVYTKAQASYPALAAYPTLTALVDELRPSGDKAFAKDAAKRRLLSALLVEAQRSQHPLWGSLLAVAFAPMLRGIRRKTIPCRGDTPEDVDARVLTAFLEGVRKANPAFPVQGLLWGTQESAWAAGDAELREERLEEGGERVWFDGDSFDVEETEGTSLDHCDNPFAEEDRMIDRITARRIAHALDAKGERPLLAALLCAGDDKDDLRSYVERTFGELPPRQREREYERLRKEQRDAVKRLRKPHRRDAA